MIRGYLVALVALGGCTERVQLVEEALPGLVSLEVTPAETALAITDLAQPPQTVTYTALGRFVDGTSRDVTALVEWTTDNAGPGSFVERGSYTTSGAAAGHVAIRATSDAIAGDARLTVVVTATIIDSTFPPPPGLFAPGTAVVTGDPIRSPAVVYPSNDTMFPQGLARILFQYEPGLTNDAFRLGFESDVLHLTVLTGSDRWQPDELVWQLISRSHPGAAATFTVEAEASTSPGTLYASSGTAMHFARSSPEGVLYYFSDTTGGVMRSVLGSPTAGKLFPGDGDTRCVGCHAVSRDGRTMAFGLGGEKLSTLALDPVTPLLPATSLPMGWATFSPDGSLLLVADKGELTLRDATTGAPVGPGGGKLELPGHALATHPDWSPDGAYVAVAIADTVGNMDMKGGAIARIPYLGGAWGDPEILVPADGGMHNNYFPRWSPDGRFLAYVHADGASRNAKTAELRVIAAEGGTPTPLRIASHRVATVDDVPELATTMPTWAPRITDGIAWLAFASKRPYGAVRPVAGDSQIWIAGVELDRPGDPSFAAFWLPSQDITALANNPIWAPAPAAVE